jgi:Zn-dependent peptidase ImmA (M78 family)
MTRVEINPTVLHWAMHRAKTDPADLGHPQETVEAWLSGSQKPTFNQARELAKDLHIPFGYLFLDTVPEIEIPIPDLRTVGNKTQGSYSPEFIDILYDALRKQSWYRNYRIEQGYEPLGFVGSFDTSADPIKVAANMREWIDNTEIRQKANGWKDYLTLLTRQAEMLGILVLRSGVVGSNTHRALSVEEFRGFAIVDEYAPIVFLNTKDTRAALVFTLAHELAHLWIGQSAISDIGLKEIPEGLAELEKYCNKVAVEFLVPQADFAEKWQKEGDTIEIANSLARTYRVSTLVILRRAYELNYINKSLYFDLYEKILEQMVSKDKEENGGGQFYPTFYARNGTRFVNDVVNAVASGQETYRQASSLLGASVAVVSNLVSSAVGGLPSGEVPA